MSKEWNIDEPIDSDSLQCFLCKHYLGQHRCEAFEDRIPEKIFDGLFDHRMPYKGDKGVRFELASDWEEENENAFKTWTDSEDKVLDEKRKAGCSIKDIAETVGRTPSAVKSRIQHLRIKKIRLQQTISHEEDDIILHDADIQKKFRAFSILKLIEPENQYSANKLYNENIQKKLDLCLSYLSDRDKKIIEEKYLTYEGGKTFESLAEELHVSRQRVKQIEKSAILKMQKYYQEHDISSFIRHVISGEKKK